MKTLKSWRLVAIALVAAASCTSFVACSGDDTEQVNSPGKDASTEADTSVTPVNDAAPDTADSSVTPQGVPPGCFTGTPVDTLDFQNACTTADYVVFDNCARIGYCDGGTLPALVTPTVDAGADTGTPADSGVSDSAADADGG